MPSFALSNVTVTPETTPPVLSVTTPLTDDVCWDRPTYANARNANTSIANTLRNLLMNPPKRSLAPRAFAKFQILVQQLVNHIHWPGIEGTVEYVSETTVFVTNRSRPTRQISEFRFGFVYLLSISGFPQRFICDFPRNCPRASQYR